MSSLMDRFFISIGFEPKEIQASCLRGWLYIGMVYMIGMTTAFGVMSVLS